MVQALPKTPPIAPPPAARPLGGSAFPRDEGCLPFALEVRRCRRFRRAVPASVIFPALLVLTVGGTGLTVPGAIAQPVPSAPAGETTSRTYPEGDRLLQLGSQGAAVREIQAMLALLGFYPGEVDGVYQATTAAAVREFQTAAGIAADGVVGPSTWQRLFPLPSQISQAATPAQPVSTNPAPDTTTPTPAPTAPAAANPAPTPASTAPQEVTLPILRPGTRGPAVARLQERLRALGFYSGVIDGVFGPQTETAVRAAQRNFSLNPDGIVGPATWTALLR